MQQTTAATRIAPRDMDDHNLRDLDQMRAGTTMSLNAALLVRLRGDLLNGTIEPDVKLKVPSLCERYGVSAGVAREALSRLASEGLVDATDQRGFRTPALTVDVIKDTTRVRLMIEREALADAIRHGDGDWEARVVAAHHRLQHVERAAGDTPPYAGEEWSKRHKELHCALISATTSPWLLRLHNMFYDQTERYRFLAARAGNAATGQKREVPREHAAIVEATIAREEGLALALMEKHLLLTAERAQAAAAYLAATQV